MLIKLVLWWKLPLPTNVEVSGLVRNNNRDSKIYQFGKWFTDIIVFSWFAVYFSQGISIFLIRNCVFLWKFDRKSQKNVLESYNFSEKHVNSIKSENFPTLTCKMLSRIKYTLNLFVWKYTDFLCWWENNCHLMR
jgi:hypothetical protein